MVSHDHRIDVVMHPSVNGIGVSLARTRGLPTSRQPARRSGSRSYRRQLRWESLGPGQFVSRNMVQGRGFSWNTQRNSENPIVGPAEYSGRVSGEPPKEGIRCSPRVGDYSAQAIQDSIAPFGNFR